MLGVKEGTLFAVVRFPPVWPSPTRTRLLQLTRGGASLELWAETDGSLAFAVRDSAGRIAHRTQPIALSGPGWAIMIATWNAGSAQIHVGGEPLLSNESGGGAHKLVRTTEHQPGAEPAWKDPDAPSACARWVQWRTKNLGIPKKTPARGRREKALIDQVQELRRASQILHDLSALVQLGRTHLLGHLAAELRALTYWNGRSYDPLLLRLAARAVVPLPIYVIADTPSPLEGEMSIHVRRGEASIVKQIPTQVVVDLQDWLESKLLSERGASGAGQGTVERLRHLTVKDLIAGVANTLGAAHYDQDMPRAVQNLAQVEGPIADEVTVVLLLAASLVIPLSLHVVTILEADRSLDHLSQQDHA